MELIASLAADTPLSEVPEAARRAQRLGFDTLHVPETFHDPFVTSTLALEHAKDLVVRTSMVVAFPRSPMVTAYAAWQLAGFSGGRFQLGLASQVRGNIVGRYSGTWSDPVRRLRDYVGSLRAIFTAFQDGRGLDYEGSDYRFDRLQPYFNPGPIEHPEIPIWTGGVNDRMCELGGAVADGFVCHPAASHPVYLDTRIRQALRSGAAHSGRGDGGPRIVANARPLVGRTGADVHAARDARRRELAFLYSTPAYRAQLDVLGHGDLGERLTELARDKRWEALAGHLTDEVLDELVPVGTWEELPGLLDDWYAGRCDGLSLELPPADEDGDGAVTRFLRRARAVSTLSGN